MKSLYVVWRSGKKSRAFWEKEDAQKWAATQKLGKVTEEVLTKENSKLLR